MCLINRCISHSSDVLQLSHSGLRPHQLDKVATALMEAPWIKKLDLSGECVRSANVRGAFDSSVEECSLLQLCSLQIMVVVS